MVAAQRSECPPANVEVVGSNQTGCCAFVTIVISFLRTAWVKNYQDLAIKRFTKQLAGIVAQKKIGFFTPAQCCHLAEDASEA